MEDQKLLDFDTDILEHEPHTISLVTNDGISSKGSKNNHQSDMDELILTPEKVKENTEKPPPFENTFEVIDQDSKFIHDAEDDTEITDASKNEELEDLFGSDPVSIIKEDTLVTSPKTESPVKEKPVASEKLDSKIINTPKTVISHDNEPINVVKPEIEVVDTPAIISKVPTKKDTEEGDVCDIKIGPEELFCRIGLGKILK